MKKLTVITLVILCMMLSAAALAASGSCGYFAVNGDHSWDQVEIKMPTCTEDGYYILECTVCGETKKEITDGAYGHDWELTDLLDPTCTEHGYAEYTCSECGETGADAFMPLGHDWVVSSRIEGSCTTPGYIHYSCANGCGDTKTDTVKANGHKWRDLYEIRPATCTLAGSMQTECRECGEVGTRMTELLPHEYDDWMVTKEVDNGLCVKMHTCIFCGRQEAEEYYPEGTLYRGISAKQPVKDLQAQLVDCGYLNDSIDGIFGKNTEQAVKDFQKKNSLHADGVAWPQTINRLNAEWERMMGISVTATPVPTPTPAPTLVPTAVPVATPEPVTGVLPHCTRVVHENNAEEIVYCENHTILMEMCDALVNAASTDASRTRALNQVRNLWIEEVNLLYEGWIAASDEADKATITNSKAMFSSYLASQEALWKMQYRANPDEATQKVIGQLMDQCVTLCGVVAQEPNGEEPVGEQVSTANGYVSVSLTDGWYAGKSVSADSVTLNNDAVGPADSAWITVTDSQKISGIEQAKQIAMFGYQGGEFTEIGIGDNFFHYISNSDGSVFTLVAETSTGMAMKVDARNCTLEQARSLLETIVIR